MESFQTRFLRFARACFGLTAVSNKTERAHRFFEEAVELVQAAGMTRNIAIDLVMRTFEREVGTVSKELPQVQNTLVCLAEAYDVDLELASDLELERCWQNVDKIRAKWIAKPRFHSEPIFPSELPNEEMLSSESTRRTLSPKRMDPHLEDLIRASLALPPMTAEQIQEQRISFCFGMLPKGSTNTREQVAANDYAKYGNLKELRLQAEAQQAELHKLRERGIPD